MQDDAHISVLTVKETLTFAAMLRLRESSSQSKSVQKAVADTMELLGLKTIGDNYIGTFEERTISLGQLRRVTIGVEIVHRPSVIFLDEPTSGLDSYLASTVVDGLKTLSLSQRTICCTIHQPSAKVFEKFDKLLLLSSGFPIYFGPISQCQTHFERIGYVSEHTNPAEFVLEIATKLSSSAQITREQTPGCDDTVGYELEIKCCLDSLSKEETNRLDQTLLSSQQSAATPDRLWGGYSYQDLVSCVRIVSILFQRDLIGMRRRKFWLAVTLRSLLFGVFLGLSHLCHSVSLSLSLSLSLLTWLIRSSLAKLRRLYCFYFIFLRFFYCHLCVGHRDSPRPP
jgi:ABC-type multidrug transport system ATPase subunit